MLKNIAIIFGAILIIVGILGFIPTVTPNGYLLGIFHVNAEHNWVHLITGIVAVICGFASEDSSRLFFKIFGVIYAIVALLGIFYVDRPILGLIANNIADVILHIIIAGVALYLGFGCCRLCKKADHKDKM